jgi:uncharacterized membrane protein
MAATRIRARDDLGRWEARDPIWPAQLALLVAIGLGFTLPDELTLGPSWLLPGIEAFGLVALIATTPHPPSRENAFRRWTRFAVITLVSAANLVALVLLTEQLVSGGRADPRSLLVAGVVLWATSVLLFAVWFWEFDQNGPVGRLLDEDGAEPDFKFPQMELGENSTTWRPRFTDYLYLSVTNASSFAPAESAPLSRVAQLLCGLQSVASLMVTTIVFAYAVNSLH